ncbi:MAG: NFACT RNA binding domain-containing protein [Candidatus Krumholzibacteriia bacterium]
MLERFRTEQHANLEGAVVRRVVCVVDGLILELGDPALELAFLAPAGVAWVYCLTAGERARLHDEIAAVFPALAERAPEKLGWSVREASALDALRAWLVRPAPGQPTWFRLEGARIRGLRAGALDRRLWIDLEVSDALGRVTRLELVAELIDHAANFILSSGPDNEPLANWRGRRPAPEVQVSEKNAPGASAPHSVAHPVWDAERGVVVVAGADSAPGLSLLCAAHLQLAQAGARSLAAARRRSTRREGKRLRNLVRGLEEDARKAGEAAAWRRRGELLSANLHRVRRGQSRVTVENLHADGAPVEIELDPKLSPHENAALFFKRARRGARGRATIESRLRRAREDLEAARTRSAGAPVSGSWPEVLRHAVEVWDASISRATARMSREGLWSPGGPPWQATPPARTERDAREDQVGGPGRRVVLPGNWEVRVGRSNEENDELTHRFARPNDVWLHACGVPGSHVVLRVQNRSGNPPRDILEAAAAIAARFSKAKHAGTVPVIWTRKRYVRKPRGAKPGVATCTHEKTLFVRPALPDEEPR